MKRIFVCFLCLVLLIPPVFAAPAEKYVALTFDDGPSGRFTRRLLEGLAERDVKATFLLCGYRIRENPALARRIFQEGHEIGLHGYSHDNMSKMTGAQVTRELRDTLALMPEGCKPAFFRPPGGNVSQDVLQSAKTLGIAVLGWSVDPRDWAVHDAGAVQAAVLGDVEDGDVILLHDLSDSSVDAALAIVDTLLEWGFQVVTASELARQRGVNPAPGVIYRRFP